jgi:hypothetical protein|tara:strand:- start:694 stop:1185 length:492 start_codon:yes stop_codon:yes gene_type:complete
VRKFFKVSKNRIILLLAAMGVCLGVGLYLDKEKQYKVIFEKNSVYHIKGKNNNCLWIINIKDKVTTRPGDTSVAFIGIPSVQSGASLGVLIQVTRGNVLVAFNLPGSTKNYSLPPIVLTSDIRKIKYPVKYVSFSWMRSSNFVLKLHKDLNNCVKDGAGKDDP